MRPRKMFRNYTQKNTEKPKNNAYTTDDVMTHILLWTGSTTFRTADGASLAVQSSWVELCRYKWGLKRHTAHECAHTHCMQAAVRAGEWTKVTATGSMRHFTRRAPAYTGRPVTRKESLIADALCIGLYTRRRRLRRGRNDAAAAAAAPVSDVVTQCGGAMLHVMVPAFDLSTGSVGSPRPYRAMGQNTDTLFNCVDIIPHKLQNTGYDFFNICTVWTGSTSAPVH